MQLVRCTRQTCRTHILEDGQRHIKVEGRWYCNLHCYEKHKSEVRQQEFDFSKKIYRLDKAA